MNDDIGFPLEIAFRDIGQSDAVEARIRKEVAKLKRFHQRITSCRVVIAAPHRSKHKGKLYYVQIQMTVPNGNLWVNRRSPYDHAHEDVYVAIRDAFDAAARRLESGIRRRLVDVPKRREIPPHGTVARMFRDEGYGFIRTPDEREIYFNTSSVVNDGFQRLDVGSEVRFDLAPDDGPAGPVASTVRPIGKHHIVAR